MKNKILLGIMCFVGIICIGCGSQENSKKSSELYSRLIKCIDETYMEENHQEYIIEDYKITLVKSYYDETNYDGKIYLIDGHTNPNVHYEETEYIFILTDNAESKKFVS